MSKPHHPASPPPARAPPRAGSTLRVGTTWSARARAARTCSRRTRSRRSGPTTTSVGSPGGGGGDGGGGGSGGGVAVWRRRWWWRWRCSGVAAAVVVVGWWALPRARGARWAASRSHAGAPRTRDGYDAAEGWNDAVETTAAHSAPRLTRGRQRRARRRRRKSGLRSSSTSMLTTDRGSSAAAAAAAVAAVMRREITRDPGEQESSAAGARGTSSMHSRWTRVCGDNSTSTVRVLPYACEGARVNAHGHLSSRSLWKPTRPGGQRLSLSVTQLYRRRCNSLFILIFLSGFVFVAKFAHWRWTPPASFRTTVFRSVVAGVRTHGMCTSFSRGMNE